MSETKIIVIKNGPLLVQGSVNITGENGQSIPVSGPKCALCRCGASENKPFCDGAHNKISFQAAGAAAPGSKE